MKERAATVTADDVVAMSGASARDVENWIGRLKLATKYRPTVRGRPRQFSRDNALEISLIAEMKRLGVSLSDAVLRAKDLFEMWRNGAPQEWALFFWDKDNHEAGLCFDGQPDLRMVIQERLGFVVVNTGKVIERVDKFFSKGD